MKLAQTREKLMRRDQTHVVRRRESSSSFSRAPKTPYDSLDVELKARVDLDDSLASEGKAPIRPHLLRLAQLLELVPVSRATIYRWIDHDCFPAPVKLSQRMSAWRASEVEEWMMTRKTDHQKATPH